MKIRIFGKDIFEFRSAKENALWSEATVAKKDSKFLPDFYEGGLDDGFVSISNAVAMYELEETVKNGKKAKKQAPKPSPSTALTPKGVYELQLLNDKSFKLNTDSEYVDQQLVDFKDKLGLIKSEEYDMRRGVNEISSVITRLENRKKYAEVKEQFEEFAYTTTSKISALLKDQSHLQMGKVAQFLADMPKEATDAMKRYNVATDKVCGKQAVFYIIADKKDFRKSDNRRDPILLAQSPFGHFWQILGAWDEEMLFLEAL